MIAIPSGLDTDLGLLCGVVVGVLWLAAGYAMWRCG